MSKIYSAEYVDSCKTALGMHKKGISFQAIAKALEANGYVAASGGVKWYYSTAQRAVAHAKAGITSGERPKPPNPPKGGKSKKAAKPSKPAKAKNPVYRAPEAIPAKPSSEAAGTVAILPGTRRPMKRMLSKEAWETMPETIRREVVREIVRQLASSDK